MGKPDILELASELKADGEIFALATVVRTVSVTAAKAGARALIRSDGVISDGWIGGGCAKNAVVKAAREAISSGETQLISLQPEHLLDEQGLTIGSKKGGVKYAANHCPSKGTMDIFVEPVSPKPELLIFGSSPVAVALSVLAAPLGFFCSVCAPKDQHEQFSAADQLFAEYPEQVVTDRQRFVVVSTQGKGDEEAIRKVMELSCDFISFVGSNEKALSLRTKISSAASNLEAFDKIKVPAGLDLGAITPEEIALSIFAEITVVRRKGHRTKKINSENQVSTAS